MQSATVWRAGSAVLATVLATGLARAAPPWARTESRVPCASFDPLRQPYFGDLHVHTLLSADASIYGTTARPRDAYAFARGRSVTVADSLEQQTRTARLERPLDFAAVTDHAEFLGEVLLCTDPESTLFSDPFCELLRQPEPNGDGQFVATINWLFPAGVPDPPASHAICDLPGIDCDAAAASAWQETQAAAEEAYDRTAACTFTTFVGYENTNSPLGLHLHRNVVFRNHHVPALPASHLETRTPQGVWSAIETDCLGAGTGCDAVVIPHNTNLSGGEQWLDPADATEALRRQLREPLVEIHQQKGNSECRFDRLAGAGAGTTDELCTFEQDPDADQSPFSMPPPIDAYPRRNMVRNALKDGLRFEDTLGANPFRLGFVGSTDTHNATAGNVDEVAWVGGEGVNDSTPALQIDRALRTNPGGLAVVWAEENSRDAVFSALARRETYATSGPRPVVRFFAGRYEGDACGRADLVAQGYERGTPMGGELGAVRGRRSPDFVVSALKDPGTAERQGTDLQRLQIVKGWVDAAGEAHERTFDVAGDPENGAGVDPATCAPVGRGAAQLCAVWRDPAFDPTERAFYYVRLLENPTCRWSTLVCRAVGVDPLAPDCAAQAAVAGEAFADCCLDETSDPFVSPVVQERAWTSPVWYRPDGVARLDGRITVGRTPGRGALALRLRLARMPSALAPPTADLTLSVSDDEQRFRVTIPADAWRRAGPGRFALSRARRRALGLRTVALGRRHDGGAVLRLRSGPLDLEGVEMSDHVIRVELTTGVYHVRHERRWQARRHRLESRRS